MAGDETASLQNTSDRLSFQKGDVPLPAVSVTEIVHKAYVRKFADQLLPAE